MVKVPQLDQVCELNRSCLQCQLSISGHLDCSTSEIICCKILALDQFHLKGLVVWCSSLLLLLARFLHHLLVHPVA